MTVFDTFKHIWEKDYTKREELDKLDEVMTAYGIEHSFALPSEDDEHFDEVAVDLYYEAKDRTKLFFVYGLWLIANGTRTEDELKESIENYAGRE